MNESLRYLGNALGLTLLPRKKAKPLPTVKTIARIGETGVSKPMEIPGSMHLGETLPSGCSPELLHTFAKARNYEIMEILKQYAQILENPRWNAIRRRFYSLLKVPRLEASTRDHREYEARHLWEIWRQAGLSSLFSKDNPDSLSGDSIAASFLIPTYVIYEQYYAQNAGYKPPESAPPDARDLAAWKSFILHYRHPSTRFFRDPLTSYVPFETFKRHGYIVGGSGSGKSELLKLIVHHLLEDATGKTYSAVVIDPHGDLVDEIARFRIADPSRVVYFNPALSKHQTPSLDILTPPDSEEETIDTMAGNLADAFNEIIADTSISAQMRTVLIPCISVLLRRKNSSLRDLQRFMVEGENEDLIALGQKSPNAGQAQFFRVGFGEKTYDTTKRSIYTRLQTLLNSTMFRRMTSPHATLSLENELNSGKIVLFSLSKSAIGNDVSAAFGRLIIAQVKNIGFRRQRLPKTARVPSFILVDECQNYVGESVETVLAELRKFGIHMVLANQVIGQNMSTQLTNILLSNTAVKIAGYNGEKSLSIMAKEMGADIADLKRLTTGNFCAKVNTPGRVTEHFYFTAPNYLVGNKGGVSGEEWLARLKHGWRGYVKNELLDQLETHAPESKRENEHTPRNDPENRTEGEDEPDYIDTPEKQGKPRFDL